jgi:hypothetical protein
MLQGRLQKKYDGIAVQRLTGSPCFCGADMKKQLTCAGSAAFLHGFFLPLMGCVVRPQNRGCRSLGTFLSWRNARAILGIDTGNGHRYTISVGVTFCADMA